MVNRKRGYSLLIALLCFFPALNWGTLYHPWLGNSFEFEWRNSLLYQNYKYISSDSRLKRFSSDDVFFNTSLSNAYDKIGLELELTIANTPKQRIDVDHFKATLRYVLLDELTGDPLTLTTGASFSQAFQPSLHDISSFHHGHSEVELFVAAGMEVNDESNWTSRWWGMTGMGFAERGKPWYRIQAGYEKIFCKRHELGFFIHTLWGLGPHKLHPYSFHGYGSIQHHSADVAFRYTYLIEYFGNVSLEYSRRVYARNFPAQTNCVLINILYQFGL